MSRRVLPGSEVAVYSFSCLHSKRLCCIMLSRYFVRLAEDVSEISEHSSIGDLED